MLQRFSLQALMDGLRPTTKRLVLTSQGICTPSVMLNMFWLEIRIVALLS